MDYKLVDTRGDKEVKDLWSYCFEHEDEPFFKWYFAKYYRAHNTLGAYEQGRMTACLQMIPYEIFLRGQRMPVSYIVGVGTCPEVRGSGGAGELLKAALAEMRERGHAVSLLMPSKAGFYYPYQWELCYHHYKYILPLRDLVHSGLAWGSLYPLEGEADISKLSAVYEKFVALKHGYVLRSTTNWRQLVEEHFVDKGFLYLLEHDGQPEGYIMYSLQDKQLTVREMAYTGIKAQKSLLRFLYGHHSQAETIEWNAPLDDLTYFTLPDPKKDVKLFPFMAARIVDVARVLATISYPKGLQETVSFEVTDELAPWNDHTFILKVRESRGEVEVQNNQEGDVKCPVGGLSQLIFGRLSAEELTQLDRFTAKTPETLAKVEKLFPVCNNYINEYY